MKNKQIVITSTILLFAMLLVSMLTAGQIKLNGKAAMNGKGKGGGGGSGSFSLPSTLTWEQVPSTPEYAITIAKVGTKLFVGTRSGLPTTYLGGVWFSDNGGAWTKANAGLSSRISICSDWPTPCATAPGGTFTLSYSGQTTSALSVTSSNATLQSALEGLSTIGSGNISVTDGPLGQSATLTFQGARANDDPTDITLNPAGLTGSTPGGMIRGPRLVAQLVAMPSGTMLANIRNNTVTEMWRLPTGTSTWVRVTGLSPTGPTVWYDYDADGNGNVLATNVVSSNNILRSTDDGASWNSFATISEECVAGSDPRPMSIYRAATSVAPNNTIFAGAHNDSLHYSTDSGATWHCMELPDGMPVGGVGVTRVAGNGQPMFGGEFGEFYVHTSPWGSADTWAFQNSGCLTGGCETIHDAIVIGSGTGSIIVHANRPYRSNDNGLTWALQDSGMPAGNINNFDGGGFFSIASHTMVVGPDKKLYLAIVNQAAGWGIYRTTVAVVP